MQPPAWKKQPWQSEETVTGWHYDFNDQIFNSYTMRQNRKILSLVTEIKDSDSGTLGNDRGGYDDGKHVSQSLREH